tara:strand:+ start:376 stop:576 length:201 start_codon:yes stop_codon:yes gene_type:complete
MKVGDLVRCTWQPGSSRIEDGAVVQMEHWIKGELGIIVRQHKSYYRVSFPQFGYEHDLSKRAIEVL